MKLRIKTIFAFTLLILSFVTTISFFTYLTNKLLLGITWGIGMEMLLLGIILSIGKVSRKKEKVLRFVYLAAGAVLFICSSFFSLDFLLSIQLICAVGTCMMGFILTCKILHNKK